MLFIQHYDITHFDDRGTTISASVSYVFCQSVYAVLREKKKNKRLIKLFFPSCLIILQHDPEDLILTLVQPPEELQGTLSLVQSLLS